MISKLIAAQKNGLRIPIKKRDVILYLGASHGVTARIISKMVGPHGFVFCLDISPKPMMHLVKVCEAEENMAPLLFDANRPELYKKHVPKVDVIYQDVAQKNQVEILKKNVDIFLKDYGYAILVLKTKSVDVVADKEKILKLVLAELKKFLDVVDYVDLSPYHKEHFF
ncbi:MAG: fibrillarin-like rRNA/tRNA 2'-O-methyltransferase, partial [Candidatus Nanoarchaeia archaeon]